MSEGLLHLCCYDGCWIHCEGVPIGPARQHPSPTYDRPDLQETAVSVSRTNAPVTGGGGLTSEVFAEKLENLPRVMQVELGRSANAHGLRLKAHPAPCKDSLRGPVGRPLTLRKRPEEVAHNPSSGMTKHPPNLSKKIALVFVLRMCRPKPLHWAHKNCWRMAHCGGR